MIVVEFWTAESPPSESARTELSTEGGADPGARHPQARRLRRLRRAITPSAGFGLVLTWPVVEVRPYANESCVTVRKFRESNLARSQNLLKQENLLTVRALGERTLRRNYTPFKFMCTVSQS